ncbi:hypothetical protein [Algoriphagus sp. A40]|uniref:hypothetical protein n=1 Tax=Algoriphagus sp. A40 TaxID=1945863 RepID=UPI0009843DD6|nr:hypothetical protein [Algoriphagus sp. A40]OOG76708.1 hypothetical protein B0E43_06830 [Algoriphagus sp. A40]
MPPKKNEKKSVANHEQDPDQLWKALKSELKCDCTIRNGKLKVLNTLLEREISSLQEVHELNWDHENLKIEFQSVDWIAHFISLPEGAKLAKFAEMAEDIYQFLGKEYYYQILADIITTMKTIGDWKYDVLELINLGNHSQKHLMEAEELGNFHKLPESFTVFRGVGLNDKQHDVEDYLSTSWTLDLEIAKLHAKKSTGVPILFKYEVQKREVLAYFSRYGQHEILLDFMDIDFQDVEIEYLG